MSKEGLNVPSQETNWDEELKSIQHSLNLFMTANKLTGHDLSDENAQLLLEADKVKKSDFAFTLTDQYGHSVPEQTLQLFTEFLRDLQSEQVRFKLFTDTEQTSLLVVISPNIH